MFSRVIFGRTARALWRLQPLWTNQSPLFRTHEGSVRCSSMADAGGEGNISKKYVIFLV